MKARSSGLEDQEVLSVKGTGNASQQVAQGHRERAESSRGKVAGHHQRVPESRGGPGQARDSQGSVLPMKDQQGLLTSPASVSPVSVTFQLSKVQASQTSLKHVWAQNAEHCWGWW